MNGRISKWIVVVLAWGLSASEAHAYPELIRHGYVNCGSCHVSPSGGGLLTDYGRSLSKEVLSKGKFFFEPAPIAAAPQAAAAPESDAEKFLWGAVQTPKWLSLGGDVRFLQLVQSNSKMVSGNFYLMQMDLEAMVQDGKRFRVVGTLGRSAPHGAASSPLDFLISRRHWVGVDMGPDDRKDLLQLRIGRFFPTYGLNIQEHTTVTRTLLGFGEQQETYNAEIAWLDENWNVFVDLIAGRPDNKAVSADSGMSVQVSRAISTTARVGMNGKKGSQRDAVGVFGTVGFNERTYALAEVDQLHQDADGWSSVEYLKIGWEFDQGVHAFATQEWAKGIEGYGIGLQYFPRPHWEFQLSVREERREAVSQEFQTLGWALLHYYL